MAIKCDKNCSPCQTHKQDIYICLKSEAEFLLSLLRLGQNNERKRNLLGFEPSELIDWYLYAKRSFSTWSSRDKFGWSIKLLDELGKIIFGITQVTAKAPSSSTFILLCPAEQDLLNSFLGPEFYTQEHFLLCRTLKDAGELYATAKANIFNKCVVAQNELQDATLVQNWRNVYTDLLECRIAYTQIREVAVFHWDSWNCDVCLILSENASASIAQLKLAAVYLHGVARFALPKNENFFEQSEFGYWIEPTSNDQVSEARRISTFTKCEESYEEKYGQTPIPSTPQVQLACELAASFAQEYFQFIQVAPSSCDLLFMCKESSEKGWFWVFTDSQLRVLQSTWKKESPRMLRALEQFRFSQAGIINHLQRSENLIEQVHDFTLETFICATAGYQLEKTREEVEAFEQLEKSLPGVNTGSYYYFRISSHSHKEVVGSQIQKELPEGSLVAIFRLDRHLSNDKRLKNMAIARHFVERWRAKVDSLITVRNVVHSISLPYQVKTARAAIMSRNLSHNVGSHALANSRFFEALGVFNALPSAPTEAEKKSTVFVSHVDDANLSPIRKGELWNARNRLSAFNSYLQGRMDFIARALGESTSQIEPMFFMNDVIRGFLSQTILLNTFLSDIGYVAADLEFHLTIMRKGEDIRKCVVHVFRGVVKDDIIRHVEFEQDLSQIEQADAVSQFEDVLVAMPGGMVGRHAFFAFMENYMRNAAKYGTKSRQKGGREKLIIHMLLEEQGEATGALSLNGEKKGSACYALTLWDNVSLNYTDVAGRIRKHLNQAIIDDQGRPRSEGHGIQEMKVCAMFLAGGDREALVFPVDQYHISEDGHCAGQAYLNYLNENNHKDDFVKIKEHNSLLCYVSKQEDGQEYLTYVLLFQQPRLLGIVEYDFRLNSETEITKEASVVFYKDIRALAEKPAYFGLILLRDVSKLDQILNDISPFHSALPFRLMVVVEDEGILGEVKTTYEASDHSMRARIWRWQRIQADDWWEKKPESSNQFPPFPMPCNRVRAIAVPELFSIAPGCQPSDLDSESWRKIIMKVYDEWLWAYKGHELKNASQPENINRWHLGIGFDRSQKTVRTKWMQFDENGIPDGLGFTSKHLVLHVFARKSDKDASRIQITHYENDNPYESLESICKDPRALLVLDNHKKVLSELGKKLLKDSPASYHPFSGSEQIALFQMLETPPTDPFARAFLIFSVAEALLTRVVIIDERVSQACMEAVDPTKPVSVFRYKNEIFQKARIYPLYSVESEQVDGSKLYFSLLPGQNIDIIAGEKSVSESSPLVEVEGLSLTPYSHVRPGNRQQRKATILAPREATKIAEAALNNVIETYQIRKSTDQLVYGELVEEYPDEEVASRSFDGGSLTADFVIIHEGVIDQLKDNGAWCPNAHEEIYHVSTSVVRTSGRGATSRHLAGHLPFIEFSELSDTTYLQMNKVSLGKGLLALRGGIPER